MLIATTYSALNKFFDLFPPVLIGLAVDTVVKKEDSFVSIFAKDIYSQLIIISIFTILIWILESIFEYLFVKKWKIIAQEFQNDLRIDTYSHFQNLDHSYLENQRTGNLMAILNDDVNQLENFLNIGLNELIQLSVTVLMVGGYFFYVNPPLAGMAFCVIPLIITGSVLYQRFLEKRYKKVREKAGLLNSELNNNIEGISTIKAFISEEKETRRIKSLSRNYLEKNEDAITYSALFTPLIRMLILGAFVTTLLIGGKKVINGSMEVGTYSVLIFLIQRLLWPMTRLGNTLDLYQKSMASFLRVTGLLAVPRTLKSGQENFTNQQIEKIEFKNISFAYQDDFILKDFNLTIRRGEKVALVGETGSGKSTISKLLLRFYDPQEGQILINGKNIKEYKIQELRGMTSWVAQDVYLFHGSILKNITYGNDTATNEEIKRALEFSTASDFIDILPLKTETIIGERGQKLSGGQRQRLSLARAILANRDIIILDESTSAVDNVTEARIQKNIANYLKNKTTIMIAHRLSTIINSDRIIVLEHGQILEMGNHLELLEKKGAYFKLWNIQSGMDKEIRN